MPLFGFVNLYQHEISCDRSYTIRLVWKQYIKKELYCSCKWKLRRARFSTVYYFFGSTTYAHCTFSSNLFHGHTYTYRKVASSSLSRLVAHFWVFRLFMKGKFDALAKRVQNWIVDQSTARDFTVTQKHIDQLSDPENKKCSS